MFSQKARANPACGFADFIFKESRSPKARIPRILTIVCPKGNEVVDGDLAVENDAIALDPSGAITEFNVAVFSVKLDHGGENAVVEAVEKNHRCVIDRKSTRLNSSHVT